MKKSVVIGIFLLLIILPIVSANVVEININYTNPEEIFSVNGNKYNMSLFGFGNGIGLFINGDLNDFDYEGNYALFLDLIINLTDLKTTGQSGANPNAVFTLTSNYQISFDNSCTDECQINIKSCFNESNYQICGNFDSDSCLEWGTPIECEMGPTGRLCYDDGKCAIGCNPQCGSENDKVCTDENSYIRCEMDGCPHFSDEIDCDEGEFCSEGNCIGGLQKECSQIGLREDGKFCSTEYKLEQQLESKVICENDFECVSNSCLNGSCFVKEDNNKLILWIIGILGALLIIGIIIYVISKSRR